MRFDPKKDRRLSKLRPETLDNFRRLAARISEKDDDWGDVTYWVAPVGFIFAHRPRRTSDHRHTAC